MAVRLFVGNLSYTTTEADLRTYFGTVAPPSQVVLPVDRETGGRAGSRSSSSSSGRTPSRRSRSSTARCSTDGRWRSARRAPARIAGPGGPPARAGPSGPAARAVASAPRPPLVRRTAASVRSGGAGAAAQPQFGPDAKPQRGGNAKAKKKEAERPRGPIPLKSTGRSFTLDDDDSPDEALPDIDDFATSKPTPTRTWTPTDKDVDLDADKDVDDDE